MLRPAFRYAHAFSRGGLVAFQRQRVRGLHCLTFNTGSSTLKYSLYDVDRSKETTDLKGTLLSSGMGDKIGKDDVKLTVDGKQIEIAPNSTHEDCLRAIASNLPVRPDEIRAVGHRVVHGGSKFTIPTVITPAVLSAIDGYSTLAPLHNPPAVKGIEAALDIFPDVPHVGVFDTSFHSTMPPSSFRYAVPSSLYDQGVRRYGFHGSSYAYVASEAAKVLSKPKPNLILLHLGSGASMCCVKGGLSVDTTMGMTPAEGLVMGTRAGDVDAGLFAFLSEKGHSISEIDNMLNKQSGLLGLSNLSNDFRAVSSSDKPDAKLAREVFVQRIRKYLGSYIVELNGDVDAIVFTGGIGENDASLRADVLDGLSTIGIAIDSAKNLANSLDVGASVSKSKILVIPTNEELSISLQSVEAANILPPPKESALAPKKSNNSNNKANTNKECRALFAHGMDGSYVADEELALLQRFSARLETCGYFRCIARDGPNHEDYKITLMREHFHLDCDPESMYGVTADEAMDMLAHGQTDALYEKILTKYLAYCQDKDFVLVSNSKFGSDGVNFAAQMAQALDSPAVLIGDAGNEGELAVVAEEFRKGSVDVAGAIVSGVRGAIDGVKAEITNVGLKPIAILPYEERLEKKTTETVVRILNDAKVLHGSAGEGVVKRIKVFTQQVADFMEHLDQEEGTLILTHVSRVDAIMAMLLAMQSVNVPGKLAGIVLTGYDEEKINPQLQYILNGLEHVNIPVIATADDTWTTASAIKEAPVFLTSDSIEKISLSCSLFDEHMNEEFVDMFVDDAGGGSIGGDIGPKLFQHSIFSKARALQKTIVLPEGDDVRVVEAASILTTRKLCKVQLVGTPSIIKAHASKLGVDLSGVEVIDPEAYEELDVLTDSLHKAREKKGMTAIEARRLLIEDVNYFGTLMMHLDKADGMVSGAAHSSANTIRPALQVIKMAPGASNVSSTFFMLLQDGVKCFGDCALNVDPTAEQLAEIAVFQAKMAIQFGISPRVAMLSYATGDSNSGELIDKVIKATEIARDTAEKEGFMEREMIEGPLQFDAAVDPAVAAVKLKGNPVAGRANVLTYPDLTSANAGYKGVQQASKCLAVGPILLGLRKPVNDLSRGATVGDIVNTAVITCIQADL
ncbi:hypothetical protein TrVE_jg5513 [Triparma verrucosa]|uniref:Probable acetate kinase n=1 Tax=Triparma verrucosa TaxID=1606542 RepID=A0A9W7FL99_9STRA|nr:hypothetical protein TrVE_jg5513 [Triparma verrucosa]